MRDQGTTLTFLTLVLLSTASATVLAGPAAAESTCLPDEPPCSVEVERSSFCESDAENRGRTCVESDRANATAPWTPILREPSVLVHREWASGYYQGQGTDNVWSSDRVTVTVVGPTRTYTVAAWGYSSTSQPDGHTATTTETGASAGPIMRDGDTAASLRVHTYDGLPGRCVLLTPLGTQIVPCTPDDAWSLLP